MDKIKKSETKTGIVKKYSVKNALEVFEKVSTSIEAYNSESESLATIKRNYGKETSLNLIRIWLISLNDFVNTSRKMTPAQIDEIAVYIFQDYYYLKMSDIYLIITRIKKGFYGQLFESLDGMKILSFFSKYANERANSIERFYYMKHDKILYKEEKHEIKRKSK